jgi:hypothetical protein
VSQRSGEPGQQSRHRIMPLASMTRVSMTLASMPLASAAKPPQLVKSTPLGALLPSQGNLQFRDLFIYQYCLSILIGNIDRQYCPI